MKDFAKIARASKKVMYLGQEFDVPVWAKYIVANCNGTVYAHSEEPKNYDGRWYATLRGLYREVGTVPPKHFHPQKIED